MHYTINNLKKIKEKLSNNITSKIIIVSKKFSEDKLVPLLDFGHKDFGENKIQEALNKWPNLKRKYSNINLHMIGKLQSNKVKYLFSNFEYLHTLDNVKLAEKISIQQKKSEKKIKIFIQVNLASEKNKNGVCIKDLEKLYQISTNQYNLNIIGLMCIPPVNNDSRKFFKYLKQLNLNLNLKDLSMGMSNDYHEAAKEGATYLRIGTGIMGERN